MPPNNLTLTQAAWIQIFKKCDVAAFGGLSGFSSGLFNSLLDGTKNQVDRPASFR